MTKLHEVLAAEKTPTGAWNALREETIRKFKNADHFFSGHDRWLKMIEATEANAAEEAKELDSKPVPTTVCETLEYALGIFAKAEDLQARKNATNAVARGTVMWNGKPLLPDLPVDELLGLEARLTKLRDVIEAAPTLDATKHWVKAPDVGHYIWRFRDPEVKTKTDKTIMGVTLSPATEKHPAQVEKVSKDVVVGNFHTVKMSGCCTAVQKSDAMVRIDQLLVEVKQARMRANETVVVDANVAAPLIELIMEPFRN